MVGEEMISATNGHDIKYTASHQLNSDVEKWLAKGNKVKKVECTFKKYKEIKQEDFTKSKFNSEAHVQARVYSKQAQIERSKKQQPILKEYYDMAYKRTVWLNLIERAGVKISATHLAKTMRGGTSIVKPEIWDAVHKAVISLIEDIKEGKIR